MRGIIITILFLFILPISVFAWLGTSGSSTSVDTAGYDQQTMLILSYDKGIDSWQVSIASGNVTVSGSSVTIQGGILDELKRILQSTGTLRGGQLDEILRVKESTGVISNFPVSYPDARYSSHASTGVAGKLNSTADISVTGSSVTLVTFYSDGGDTTITTTFTSGTEYVLDGIPLDYPIVIPIASPTFQCTLPADTTFYYKILGVTQQ